MRVMLLSFALFLAVACGHASPLPPPAGTDNADLLEGTEESDTLMGGAGDDQLIGRAGDDVLLGGRGDDQIAGGTGDDVIKRGEGDDVIRHGAGEDEVSGGPGADTFVLHIDTLDQGLSRIVDFNPDEGDRIAIKGASQTSVDELMKRLSIRDGVLILKPDIPGTGATGVVQIGSKYRLEMLTSKKSIIFSLQS